MERKLYQDYLHILQKELVPALGCTEPIALAYAAAKCRETLGVFPEKVEALCSGNIIKNVKGVTVPNSGGLKGIEAAVIVGITGGEAGKALEVLQNVTEEHRERTKDLIAAGVCTCSLKEGVSNLFIEVRAEGAGNRAAVRLEHEHTNITYIMYNGDVIYEDTQTYQDDQADKSSLNIRDIITFANEVRIEDVKDILSRQVQCNYAISEEGLKKRWGAGVGHLAREQGHDVRWRAIARAAAGSDARMSGCPLPVIINSGSGNQGMTCSLPVIEYARAARKTEEQLYRALCLSNLIAQDQKRYIGALSAYCGVVCAAAAAGAAVTYLAGGTTEQIENTVVNAIANIGGMVCDGAKPSCASKIYSALQAAFLGHEMAMKGICFEAGDGLVMDSAEDTVKAIGIVGREGMRQTDIEILNLMIGKTTV